MLSFDLPPSQATSEKLQCFSSCFQSFIDVVENTEDDQEIDFIDMTAGAGHYADVPEGTAIRAITLAEAYPKIKFNMTFFESNKAHAAELARRIEDEPPKKNIAYKIIKWRCEREIKRLIEEGIKRHTFICIDPCKAAYPVFDEIVALINSAPLRPLMSILVTKQTSSIHRPLSQPTRFPGIPKKIFGNTRNVRSTYNKAKGKNMIQAMAKLWADKTKLATSRSSMEILGPIPLGSDNRCYHALLVTNDRLNADLKLFTDVYAEWIYEEDVRAEREAELCELSSTGK